MAGNTVYVQGNYVDVHDNEVVNLNIDKAQVQVEKGQAKGEPTVPDVLAESELWQRVTDITLSTKRLSILDQLLNLTDKGDWVNSISTDIVKQMLRKVLGLGETPLSGKEAERSETLWQLLEKGRGDRVKIVWQNMLGYFADRHLLPASMGAPALNRMFFGDETGYTNIDKGRPSKNLMTADFESLLPLLDNYVPKVDKKA